MSSLFKKITTHLILFIIVSSLLLLPVNVLSMGDYFYIKNYNYKSSSGGDVYPGSENTLLTIEAQYNGTLNATNIFACLNVPPGFSFPTTRCSPAYKLGTNEIASEVSGGEIVRFSFRINIDKTVSPGHYIFTLNISFNYNGVFMYELHNITIHVNPYPQLILSIIDTYFTPSAYPGQTNANLVLEVKNSGNSIIRYADIKAELPSIIEPANPRATLNNLDSDQITSITFNNLMISPNAEPGVYNGKLNIYAQMETSDGVRYDYSTTIIFTFKIEEPPPLNYTVLDYGLTSNYPLPGTRNTRFYLKIQNMEGSVFRIIVANISLYNASFESGSKSSVSVVNGPINYGDVFTITSDYINTMNNTDFIKVQVEMNVLVENNGKSYWVKTSNVFFIKLRKEKPPVILLNNYWLSQHVYPGSTDQTLVVELLINTNVDITSGYAILAFDQGIFYPRKITISGLNLQGNNIDELRFSPIDISINATPGNYTASLFLALNIRDNDGSYKLVNYTYKLIVEISSLEVDPIKIINVKWSSGTAYINSTGNTLVITEQNIIDVIIESITAKIIFPNGIYSENTKSNYDIKTITDTINYGKYLTIEYNNIVITRHASLKDPFILEQYLLVDVDGSQAWINKTYILWPKINSPKLNISLLDAGFTTRFIGRETDNAGIYFTFQSYSHDQINQLILTVELPEGVVGPNEKKELVITEKTTINYLDTFTITIDGLRINTTQSELLLKINVRARLIAGNAIYEVSSKYSAKLFLNSSYFPIIVTGSRVAYNNQPATIMPNSYGLSLSLIMTNYAATTISSLRVRLVMPNGFKLLGSDSSYINNVAPGTTLSITYRFNTENITPGIYTALAKIEVIINEKGSTAVLEKTYKIKLVVEPPSVYKSKIKILSYYWGTTTPTQVFPGDRKAPLTINIINLGPYRVPTLKAELVPLDSSIKVLNNDVFCQAIEVGSSCRLTFYLDLANVSAGIKKFTIKINYLQGLYGSTNIISYTYNLSIILTDYSGIYKGMRIYVTDMGWLNNWPAYPGSRRAVYTITLANLEPYNIGSIIGVLETDINITNATLNGLQAYVAGPVNSLQTFTLSFTINVGENVKPGIYPGVVKISYYIYSGNGGIRRTLLLPIAINISDPAKAFDIIQYGWINGQPPLKIHGAEYYVVLRNEEIPSLTGLFMEVFLPDNITLSTTNTSTGKVTPRTILPSISSRQLSQDQLLKMLMQQTTMIPREQTTISIGDFASFIIKVNLYLKQPINTSLRVKVHFIDHWGSEYSVPIEIPLLITGIPEKLIVRPSSPVVVFKNGTSYIDVLIVNKYIGEIYDSYLVLIPQTPNIVPIDNVKYINAIKSGENVTVRYELIYNPVMASGYGGYMQGSSAIFSVALIYRDLSGVVNVYNTTLATKVAPFIDIELSRDSTVKYKDGAIYVNGLLVNYGISQARSVYIEIVYKNYSSLSFLGDIDPASQTAFRVELKLPIVPEGNLTVIIGYRDEYNSQYTKKYYLPIMYEEVKSITATTTLAGGEILNYYNLTIIIIAVFLAGVFYLIYKYSSKALKQRKTF